MPGGACTGSAPFDRCPAGHDAGLLFFFFEIVFRCAADGAFPVVRYVFPLGAGCYTIVGITCFGIVNVTA